eukprot:gnl/Chilomastix_caulleri/6358.p2 GENE.gnl/Chilomastix_caulleri/6358~~gnl/Chilomastix_caulleri/6358.p2  ORF type:complete len:60 (+),score=13.88 gnl/Chilomastix_caulleri/6358:115-294(+)
MPIQLNASACDFAGECKAVCPMGVLELDECIHKVVIANPDECIECGACAAACPKEALHL